MKKLLLLTTALFASLGGFASHMMGGQVTSRNIGGLTYEVTFTAYRDTVGIPINPQQAFVYTEVSGPFNLTKSVGHTGMVVFGNGVEQYSYVDTITFPNNGTYSITVDQCCRNAAILNLTNPGGESFFLNNTLLVDATNSSPVFLNPPITLAQLNVPFNYNPMPFDADGDSIVWSIDTPLTAPATFTTGWVAPSSDPLSPFTLDPLTGEISFLPDLQGYFVVSFLVKEFRGGVQIGEIRRDMQIIVVPSFNMPPVVNSNSNTFPFSGKSYTIVPGSSFDLTVGVYDPDGQGCNISGVGEALLLANNPATVNITNSTTATAHFQWTPDASQARLAPYIFAVRVEDFYNGQIFRSDITFSMRVGNATFVNETEKSLVKGIYPNPSNGNFTVEMLSEKAEDVILSVSNLIGQQIKQIPQHLNSGVNLLNVQNLDLPAGKYLISVVRNGQISETRTFEIR